MIKSHHKNYPALLKPNNECNNIIKNNIEIMKNGKRAATEFLLNMLSQVPDSIIDTWKINKIRFQQLMEEFPESSGDSNNIVNRGLSFEKWNKTIGLTSNDILAFFSQPNFPVPNTKKNSNMFFDNFVCKFFGQGKKINRADQYNNVLFIRDIIKNNIENNSIDIDFLLDKLFEVVGNSHNFLDDTSLSDKKFRQTLFKKLSQKFGGTSHICRTLKKLYDDNDPNFDYEKFLKAIENKINNLDAIMKADMPVSSNWQNVLNYFERESGIEKRKVWFGEFLTQAWGDISSFIANYMNHAQEKDELFQTYVDLNEEYLEKNNNDDTAIKILQKYEKEYEWTLKPHMLNGFKEALKYGVEEAYSYYKSSDRFGSRQLFQYLISMLPSLDFIVDSCHDDIVDRFRFALKVVVAYNKYNARKLGYFQHDRQISITFGQGQPKYILNTENNTVLLRLWCRNDSDTFSLKNVTIPYVSKILDSKKDKIARGLVLQQCKNWRNGNPRYYIRLRYSFDYEYIKKADRKTDIVGGLDLGIRNYAVYTILSKPQEGKSLTKENIVKTINIDPVINVDGEDRHIFTNTGITYSDYKTGGGNCVIFSDLKNSPQDDDPVIFLINSAIKSLLYDKQLLADTANHRFVFDKIKEILKILCPHMYYHIMEDSDSIYKKLETHYSLGGLSKIRLDTFENMLRLVNRLKSKSKIVGKPHSDPIRNADITNTYYFDICTKLHDLLRNKINNLREEICRLIVAEITKINHEHGVQGVVCENLKNLYSTKNNTQSFNNTLNKMLHRRILSKLEDACDLSGVWFKAANPYLTSHTDVDDEIVVRLSKVVPSKIKSIKTRIEKYTHIGKKPTALSKIYKEKATEFLDTINKNNNYEQMQYPDKCGEYVKSKLFDHLIFSDELASIQIARKAWE